MTQKAQEILNAMTLEEKVGQMFIARCPEINSVQKVKEYNLGGYILFSRDFSGKQEMKLSRIFKVTKVQQKSHVYRSR